MNIIKNVRLLHDVTPENIALLEQAARIHKGFAGISFKILENTPDQVVIRIIQEKHAAGNYHSGKRLAEIVKETFGKFFQGKTILPRPIPYQESPAAGVDSAWINKRMTELGIRIKDIAADTGLNRSQVNALVTGNRPLSQLSKALMYFYFLAKSKDQGTN